MKKALKKLFCRAIKKLIVVAVLPLTAEDQGATGFAVVMLVSGES
jgi:hypothetical protein